MKNTILLICLVILFFFSCSKDDPQLNIPDKDKSEQPAEPNGEDKYSPSSMEYHFFIELGLRPSQIDSINSLNGFFETKDWIILYGRRNNKAWLSKFDNSGNEIYAYEFPTSKKWKTSHYNQNSLLEVNGELNFMNNNLIFTRGWYSNVLKPEEEAALDNDQYISVIDFTTGKELSIIGPDGSDQSNILHTFIQTINNRYLIKVIDILANKRSRFYVVGEDGKLLYGREWTQNEQDILGPGVLFINDEIVAPIVEKDKYFDSSVSYPIINLKDWKLLKKIDQSDGLIPQGENQSNKNTIYKMEKTYLEGNNIKFIYNEFIIKYTIDEISGHSTETSEFKDTYYYDINTTTYKCIFRGKYGAK